MVLDTQGGDTLLRSFEVVKPGGVVMTIGGRPDGKFARAWGLRPPRTRSAEVVASEARLPDPRGQVSDGHAAMRTTTLPK
ncbi:MAG TPA: hypothetical protein VIW26_03435 [Gemmatimonadales bacterium]